MGFKCTILWCIMCIALCAHYKVKSSSVTIYLTPFAHTIRPPPLFPLIATILLSSLEFSLVCFYYLFICFVQF